MSKSESAPARKVPSGLNASVCTWSAWLFKSTTGSVWRPPQTDPVVLLNSHADQVHTLAFSPDGTFLAGADSDFDIYLWSDAAEAKVGHVLRGHNRGIR